MNIPCAKKSNFCPCTDNPLANLTSEPPDRELFIKINYYPILGPAPILLCEEASLEDLANCEINPGPCDPTVDTCPCDPAVQDCNPCPTCIPPPDTPPPRTQYYNVETSCVACGITYTVPAGTVLSYISQADADARAQSICTYRACNGPDGPHRGLIPSTCFVLPVILGYGQTSPVEKAPGDNVTLFVFYMYTGLSPVTFTWYKDLIPYSVTAGSQLTINNLVEADEGDYMLSIKALGCPPVFSNIIRLNVTPCNQSGTAVPPDFTFPPVDLGNFTITPGGSSVSLGDFPKGQFTITYINGAYQSDDNPCRRTSISPWKNTGCVFRFNGGASSVNISDPSPCGVDQAEVETDMLTTSPFGIFLANHTGGAASFDAVFATNPSCGSPCPTYHVVYQQIVTTSIVSVSIEDWASVAAIISNCAAISSNPALPVWDGIMADFNFAPPTTMASDTAFPVDTRTFDGNKEFGFAEVIGPFSRADLIATYEPDFGVGIFAALDPANYYWVLDIWGYDSGLASLVPCWLGIKEYGSDILGRYRIKSTVCALAPTCLTVIETP